MNRIRTTFKPATSLTGPLALDESTSPVPNEPNDLSGSRPDSWRFLVRRSDYPEAQKVHTCLSFQPFLATPEPDEPMDEAAFRHAYAEHLRAIILKTARETPGFITTGAKAFPMTREGAVAFFLASGFSALDVEFLTEGMKS